MRRRLILIQIVLGAAADHSSTGAAELAAGARGFLRWNDLLAPPGAARDRAHWLLAVAAAFSFQGPAPAEDTPAGEPGRARG